MNTTRPTRILILGGGFGGVYTALNLEKTLKRELSRGEVEIALVSRDNYLTFQPMLPEVVSGSIGILDTITPIRRLCPRTNLYTRAIEEVDLARRHVTLAAGVGSRQLQLEYDHLVIALGNVTTFAGQSGLSEHALPFKYLGDALTLRNHAIHALEEADIERDPTARRGLLTFVVAGGGFSGVEAVAELNDFVRSAAKSFRNVRAEEIRVVLLHAGGLILPELPKNLAEFAQRLLMKRGVELRLNTRLAGATTEAALLTNGERIETRTLVSTVPGGPNPVVAALDCPKDRGRVMTDPHLEVPGHPGVWAVGDCALIMDAGTGEASPPTAQHATREGRCAAENIAATIRGSAKRAFAFKALGKMGSLGHRSAVAEVFGLKLSGFLAWWLWRTVYLMKLPGLDRKIRVAVDWTLDLLLPSDIIQLRTERAVSIRREHFEAGQAIFQEGDHGDWLYIIEDGEVEVRKLISGQGETPIRRLGPGDCFGEIALLGDHVRTASTHSVTSANVLAIDRDACQALLSTLPPLRDFFNRLLEERVGMRPESRDALDVSNDVITMNAESLKGQIALVTGATGATEARVAQ
jgi:NADH:quinone reductase (non-electrogenic)